MLFLLIGGVILRCIIAYWLYPGFDEAYYYLYSQHLDWSYFDHPPLVAFTTGFGIWLTGIVSQFTIRLGTLTLYTVSLWLLYISSVRVFNVEAARLTLAIASIIPIFQIGFGVLTLPDSPLIFFWTASIYCAIREFFRDREYRPSYRLAILGVLVGFACLGKYHGFILGLGLVGFCLSSPRHRRALLSPWVWLGYCLFILTLFPIWYWNIQHDWISFRFQLSSRFQLEPGIPQQGYSILKLGLVFLAEIAYLFPTMGLPLWWVIWRSLSTLIRQFLGKKPGSWHAVHLPIDQKQLLILWVSLPIIFGFTLLGGKEQIMAGWPMPGFWGLTILLGYYASVWQKQSRRWVKRWLKGSGIIVSSLLLLILLHINTGTLQKPSQYALLGGFVSPQHDPSTELIDIRQLRRGFAESPILQEALHKSSFIFTNAYYLGGLIDMARSPLEPVPVTCFSKDMRGFAFWSQPEEWIGKDALYITLKRFHEMPGVTAEFRSYFRNLQVIDTIPIKRGGVVTEVFYVYRGEELLKVYR